MVDVTTDQLFRNARVSFADENGGPATPLDVPAWSSSDEAVLTVAAAADGMTAVVTVVGAGTAHVTASATGGRPSAPLPLSANSEDVVATDADVGRAVTMSIDLGAPEDKPAPAPVG